MIILATIVLAVSTSLPNLARLMVPDGSLVCVVHVSFFFMSGVSWYCFSNKPRLTTLEICHFVTTHPVPFAGTGVGVGVDPCLIVYCTLATRNGAPSAI